ncbi:reverse transcriptase domain-containing protein [uncultured Polaribacter sp.]|uniref:reverse transcriptase domain-containing protein n=1 Tax=uncultured Polaribacter sp. TaxID=174711 RepID=UPI0026181389|nr:reverse transcriptase domain-containing protein [uncultured Polaribacter sp.]
MKLAIDQEKTIKQLFAKMNSKEDFLHLLNFSKKIIYKEKTIPFTITQLNFFISKDSKKFSSDKKYYHTFEIKKKSGAQRTIHAPCKGLLEFQKSLNIILHILHTPHEAATGFIPNKSIVDNAKKHVNKNYVYNIDLKDFFPSIDAARVWGRLTVAPFNLGTSDNRKQIANMIKTLCCHTMKVERLDIDTKNWFKKEASVLPQGAATSPTLTNAICERMDIKLTGLANRFNLDYSRYADDITFSSNHNTYKISSEKEEVIFEKDTTFDIELRRIIKDQNFHIKETKVRLQKRGYRQEVTGLVVNDKINIKRSYIKSLRHNFYLWERFGYDKAYGLFLKRYLKEKGYIKKGNPNMMMVLEGKLLYLKMVKGESDSTYLKLKERFDKLTLKAGQNEIKTSLDNKLGSSYDLNKSGKNDQMFQDTMNENKAEYNRKNDINKILVILFEKGLDEAMKLYDK